MQMQAGLPCPGWILPDVFDLDRRITRLISWAKWASPLGVRILPRLHPGVTHVPLVELELERRREADQCCSALTAAAVRNQHVQAFLQPDVGGLSTTMCALQLEALLTQAVSGLKLQPPQVEQVGCNQLQPTVPNLRRRRIPTRLRNHPESDIGLPLRGPDRGPRHRPLQLQPCALLVALWGLVQGFYGRRRSPAESLPGGDSGKNGPGLLEPRAVPASEAEGKGWARHGTSRPGKRRISSSANGPSWRCSSPVMTLSPRYGTCILTGLDTGGIDKKPRGCIVFSEIRPISRQYCMQQAALEDPACPWMCLRLRVCGRRALDEDRIEHLLPTHCFSMNTLMLQTSPSTPAGRSMAPGLALMILVAAATRGTEEGWKACLEMEATHMMLSLMKE